MESPDVDPSEGAAVKFLDFHFNDSAKIKLKEAELVAAGFYLTNRRHRDELHTMEYIKCKSPGFPGAQEDGECYTITCRIE
jgi:hypothetical protein